MTAALGIINDGTGVVMFSAQTINQMVSVERILDYSQIEAEEPIECDISPSNALVIDKQWTKTGTIDFQNVTIAYKNGPNILQNITMCIKDGERVGSYGGGRYLRGGL